MTQISIQTNLLPKYDVFSTYNDNGDIRKTLIGTVTARTYLQAVAAFGFNGAGRRRWLGGSNYHYEDQNVMVIKKTVGKDSKVIF